MARPQRYDEATVLRAAMLVFWRQGYEATSMADLLTATGLSRSSLYAGFGDKRGLFLRAFAAYRTARHAQLAGMLLVGENARETLAWVFRQQLAYVGGGTEPDGCMTVNEAVELAPHDPDVQRLVRADFEAIEALFLRTVLRGQGDGSINPAHDPQALARSLTVNILGIQVMVRAQMSPAWVADAVAVLLAGLD